MKYSIYFFTLTAAIFISSCAKEVSVSQETEEVQAIERIAFGSCSREDKAEQMWDEINGSQPDVWVWLGDNIYGDTQDMAVMRNKYDTQKNRPEYQTLLSRTHVVGTWDDHDYGQNNGGRFYTMKDESQQAAMDFLDVPADAPERSRQGLYSSHIYGPEGRQVEVILLDTRYFRDTVYVENGVSQPNQGGTILGEAQWSWLEETLNNSPAELILIGSGIQFIPTEHRFEKWANFPAERQRFFDLLAANKTKNIVLLSGDRHIAEVSRIQPGSSDKYVYEVTSSGLTHTWRSAGEEPNANRVGDLIIALNYGLMEIDWSGTGPDVKVKILGKENAPLAEYPIAF